MVLRVMVELLSRPDQVTTAAVSRLIMSRLRVTNERSEHDQSVAKALTSPVYDLSARDSDQVPPLPRHGQHSPAPGAQHHQATLQQSQAQDGASLLI